MAKKVLINNQDDFLREKSIEFITNSKSTKVFHDEESFIKNWQRVSEDYAILAPEGERVDNSRICYAFIYKDPIYYIEWSTILSSDGDFRVVDRNASAADTLEVASQLFPQARLIYSDLICSKRIAKGEYDYLMDFPTENGNETFREVLSKTRRFCISPEVALKYQQEREPHYYDLLSHHSLEILSKINSEIVFHLCDCE